MQYKCYVAKLHEIYIYSKGTIRTRLSSLTINILYSFHNETTRSKRVNLQLKMK